MFPAEMTDSWPVAAAASSKAMLCREAQSTDACDDAVGVLALHQVAHGRCQISSDPPPALHDAAAAGFEKHDPGAGRTEAVRIASQPDLLLVRGEAR